MVVGEKGESKLGRFIFSDVRLLEGSDTVKSFQ